tara:strand:- start:429 stop:917 length:489 start_codon:yes stop_codon:yes gene_type:complete
MLSKNTDNIKTNDIPNCKSLKFGIIVTEWNFEITNELYIETKNCLLKHKTVNENIIKFEVPGCFEIPYLIKKISKKSYYNFDAIITLGCIIKGDTPHFNLISNSVTNEILKLSTESKIPIIFGILTVNNFKQAKERSSAKKFNKGKEFAISAIKMATIKNNL